MKKLQNNVTTPEQSKILLELGLPADSSDCCLRRILTDGGYCEKWRVDVFDFIGQIHDDYLPCWSAGRLIEIFILCTPYVEIRLRTRLVEQLIASFDDVIKQGLIDFSKLDN